MIISLDYSAGTATLHFDDFTVFLCRENGIVIETTFTKEKVLQKHAHATFSYAVQNITLSKDMREDKAIRKAIAAFDTFYGCR